MDEIETMARALAEVAGCDAHLWEIYEDDAKSLHALGYRKVGPDEVVVPREVVQELFSCCQWALSIMALDEGRLEELDPEGWRRLDHGALEKAKHRAENALDRASEFLRSGPSGLVNAHALPPGKSGEDAGGLASDVEAGADPQSCKVCGGEGIVPATVESAEGPVECPYLGAPCPACNKGE